MPLTSSPALVRTGNNADMYLPIRGDAVVFPPDVATVNNVPLDFNGNVVINALPVNHVGPTGLANVGLEVNGPTFIDYPTSGVRPNIAMFGPTGASSTFRGKLSSDTITAVKDFEPAIGVHDFQGTHNMGLTYLIDIGPIRMIWGSTNIPPPTPIGVALNFNAIPANTYDGVPGQNTQGLFVGKCLGFANINNGRGYSPFGNNFVFSVLNGTVDNIPGNIKIRNGGSINLQFDFLAIGLAKSA